MKQIFVGSAKTLFSLILMTPLIVVFIIVLKIWYMLATLIWSLW